MIHSVDPADEILSRVKNLQNFELFGNQVLIGVYQRPEKTKSGIILTEQTRGEDAFQGKAGLVLKLGPAAFVSDDNYDFKGQSVTVGDWVAIFVSDGRKIELQDPNTGEKQLCRLVEDQHIRLKIPAPDVVW
jgi:co-chaperonin GroES (HSP10)